MYPRRPWESNHRLHGYVMIRVSESSSTSTTLDYSLPQRSGNVHGIWGSSVVKRIRELGADSTYRPMFVCKMRPQSCPSQLDASWILQLLDQSARPLCGLLRATSCPRPTHETCTPIRLALKAYLPNAYNGALIANQRREFVF